jgi:iron complex outermembrane receptor protein
VKEAKEKAKTAKAEEWNRVDSASVSPLGDRKLLDTPYSISVVPGDLMENQQATTLKEVTKYLPSTQIEERGGPDVGRPQTRGFEGSVSENNRMDGMNIAVTTAYPMEQFERIEVLNGLAGSLYGPANPSGVFNFVLKRPTEKPLYRINVGYGTQSQTNLQADVGGPIGNKLGYRVNLLYNEGEGYVESSNLRRKLFSAAFDWRVFSRTVAELNFSYFDYNKTGYPGGFSYASTIKLPEAFDPTREGLGQTWAGNHLTTRTASMKVKHDFNDNWHLTAGFLDQIANRDMFSVTNTFINSDGKYRTTFQPSSSAWEVDSGLLSLNGRMKTGSILHELALGANGHERRMMSAKTSMAKKTLGTATIDDPVSYGEPDWWTDGDRYKASVLRQENVILGDTVTFNKSWSTMLSASYSWLRSCSYNTSGDNTSTNDENGVSYMASLMYKPRENITTYIMYADSLQGGDTAPSTAANAYEILEPYRSKQWEAGLKVAFNKINLSGAYFRIERPFAYTDTDNVFKVQGDQVNYGLELAANGEIFDNVAIYAGVTFLDPQLQNTGKTTTTDKQVVGVPKQQANLLVEYRMPFVTGLTPYVNLHYTGKRAANDTNTTWVGSYKTIDIGARYATKIMGVGTTWRLAVNNLTNEEYWSSIFPGSINGTGASCSAFLGTPRQIFASMEVNF